MASRWTTAFLITAIFGGSGFICESRKQAFGMAVLLGSVAFFEVVHAVVKRLLFPSSNDPRNITKDQANKGLLGSDQQGASTKRIIRQPKEYADELPAKYFDSRQKKPSMGTQTANMDPFHDAMDHITVASPNKVMALKKKVSSSASKKMKSAEKRALAIRRAKQSMAEDKMKVEAIMKKKAAEERRRTRSER